MSRMKKILNLRPKRPGPGGPCAIEMISNGGTKPGSAVSEFDVGPRARSVDLTSLSPGDVSTTSLRKRVSQSLVLPRLSNKRSGIGALETPKDFQGTKSPGSDPKSRLNVSAPRRKPEFAMHRCLRKFEVLVAVARQKAVYQPKDHRG